MKSSDSVKTYFNEIRSVPLLTKEQETELAKRVEDCLVAIIRKLLDTGVLIEEINKLKNVLSGMEEDKEMKYVMMQAICRKMLKTAKRS